MTAAFAPWQINQHSLRALHDSVIVTDMNFDERFTESGIVLLSDNGTAKGIRPRWAQVYSVGPDQQHVHVGQWILVAHGRWTRGVEIEDQQGQRTIRKVDPEDILAVSDDPVFDVTFSDAVHVDKKPSDQLHT